MKEYKHKFTINVLGGIPQPIVEILKIISFGILSILFSKVQFVIPSAVGGLSDMREIALIISVFYCRKWYSFVFISLISSLILPPEGSFMVTFTMHAIGLIAVFFSYRCLIDYTRNRLVLASYWLTVGLSYFYLLLVPIMLLGHFITGEIPSGEILTKYFVIAPAIFFEAALTTAVSALYLLYLSTTHLLEEHIRELETAREKAEESEQLKTAFLQNLSHEIRTPLNGIMGFSRMLEFKIEPDNPLREYTKVITKSGDQLINIVHDIIDASQIETNQLDNNKSTKTLTVLSHEMENLFASQMHRISINTGQNPNTPTQSDFYKLTRITYHLIDNALKFSNEKPVFVNIDLENEELSILVDDHGIGIAESQQELIFNRFRQINNNKKMPTSGNGLGLTIVHGFVNYLGGTINLKSSLGKGSTFHIRIPVNESISK